MKQLVRITCLDCNHVEDLSLSHEDTLLACLQGKCLKCKSDRISVEPAPHA